MWLTCRRADGKVFAAGENAIPHSLVSEPYADRKYRLPLSAAEVPNIRDQALVARLLRATKAISPVLDVDLGAKIIRTEVGITCTSLATDANVDTASSTCLPEG